jgi:hypothetical protein
MKKPTLRLRQVFEGPTHFKVVKPLGNPIKIAKQGLSPNLMGRLRKFAREGEVQEATEQDQQNAQDLAAESRSLDFDQVRTAPDAQVDLAPRTRSLQEIEESLAYLRGLEQNVTDAQPVDIVERPVAQPIEVIKSQSVPVEPQRVVAGTLMGTPVPVAPVMKPVSAPVMSMDEEMLAGYQRDLELERSKANPDPKAVKLLENAITEMNEAIAAASAAPAPKASPVAPAAAVAPTPAAVVAPAAAPVAPTPAVAVAPAAAPAAPVTPISQVAPPAAVKPEVTIPKGLDATKPLDVVALREYRKANPGVPDSELVLGLIKQYTPDVPANIQIADLDVQPPEGADKDTLAEFDKAKEQLIKATVDQARVDLESSRAILEANQRAQAQRLLNAEKDRETADALVSRRDALRAAVEGGFKPESLYGSNNLAGQIGSALSIALGAFASGMTGIPNYALKIYNDAVERDLDIQKSKYNSLVNQYNRLLGDAADAEKLARADLNDLAALQLEGIKASSTIKGISPATERMIAEIRAKAAKEREEVAIKQSQAREAQVEADMAQELNQSLIKQRNAAGVRASAAAGLAGLRASQAQERLDLAKLRDDFRRETAVNAQHFNVPDPVDPSKMIRVRADSAPEANKARTKILNRVTALQRVEELSGFIEKPRMIGDKIDPAYVKDVQARLVGVIENYPSLAKGTEQMVTQAQSTLAKDALSDVPIPYLRYANTLGLTQRAVKALREDATKGLANAVAIHARAGDPGREEFASKWGPEGYGGKTAVVESRQAVPAGKARVRKPDGTVLLIDRARLADALKIPGVTEVP